MARANVPADGGEWGDAVASDGAASSETRKRRPIWLAGIAALVALLAVYGLWTRVHSLSRTSPAEPGELIPASTGGGTSLAAVGPVSGLDAPCTAWLLDIGAPPDAGAYAVTTGRCAGAADTATVIAGTAPARARVVFQIFAPLAGSPAPDAVEVPVDSVAWASTRGTDLAVLGLRATYADLSSRAVAPIRPVSPTAEGTQILVAGVPVEGLAPSDQYLRGSRCQVGSGTDVLQGRWLWHDTQVVECTGILEGSEGSVVLNEAGEAVGMVTTTTITAPDGADCTLRRPCEVSDGGEVSVVENRSYMMPVGLLADCFVGGALAPGGQCALEEPTGVVPARAEAAAGRPGETVTIRADAVAAASDVRVKEGELGEVECTRPQGWREPTLVGGGRRAERASDTWRHDVVLPEDEGRLLVCVGSASQPTEIVVAADSTPPEEAWIRLIRSPVRGGVRVQPEFDPPELVRFRWVSGPQPSIDCASAEGYVAYPSIAATIQSADLPSTVCIIGIDAAGNRSEPAARSVS